MKPFHQGDLDGLCGVYAVINAIQFLVPKARDYEFCNRLMIHIVGKIYTAKDVTSGGTEIKVTRVFEYAREKVLKEIKIGLAMSNKGRAGRFAGPADAMEATFAMGRPGVFIMGYEGRDSHWTVVPQVTKAHVLLFDSCGLKQFPRKNVMWARPPAPMGGISETKMVIVAPSELNWISV